MRKNPEDRKKEIIDVAESFFSEKGYQETSVDEICDELGVAHGLFYYYFDSKEDVIEAIIERMIGELERRFEEIVEDEGMDAEEKFKKALSLSFQRKKKRSYLASYFSRKDSPRVYYSFFDQVVEMLTPFLTEIVEQGMDEGVFHTKYPEQTVRFWLNGRLFLFSKGYPDEDSFFEDMKAEAFMLERLLELDRPFLTEFYDRYEDEIKEYFEKARMD
ncbi:MAG: TetR/AcrR family transcriptional regulator [Candidatus Thermoplasmatota archaeon]|nr:TetR/AcrR family transcriptional regulator [Candidatus Thermoplasmatota archaeon]MBS3790538.1 TetR/AcrR family transcriptional regulator [Candidatus Thermoplasmatota archaeon]